ncbi:MAG: hypothetical protein HOW73_25395 [Polyangiaceae bacterium]|nr:hypothetical protein [Polyangiaceae bacterium]
MSRFKSASLSAAWLALLVTGAGCIDTDTAVFVDATIDNAEATVEEEALGIHLTGSFQLTLHLGARASGESSVTFGSFSLIDENDTVVVESLPVVSSEPAPFTVEPGGADTAVTFTIDTGVDLLPAEVKDAICAGPVIVSGIIEDSLATTSTPVESEAFSAAGCN